MRRRRTAFEARENANNRPKIEPNCWIHRGATHPKKLGALLHTSHGMGGWRSPSRAGARRGGRAQAYSRCSDHPDRRLTRQSSAPTPSQFVGEQIAWASEVLERRVGEQVGDARRVHAGVFLDLVAEARRLARFLQERAPERVEAAVDLALELRTFGVDGAELPANALDRALDAPAFGFER